MRFGTSKSYESGEEGTVCEGRLRKQGALVPAGETLMAVTGAARSPESLYRKLSPGPGMAPDEVASHQRNRIYAAMIDIVGKEGYDAVTVRLLAQRAGVSTRTFYAHFAGKEECFLCTYAAVVQGAAKRIVDSQAGVAGWLKQMERAFNAFGREIEARPQAARLALVGVFGAGPAALEQMRSTESLFEAFIAERLRCSPTGVDVPPLLTKGIVGGISCTARSQLLAGNEKELPGLADELLEWMLSFSHETTFERAKLNLATTHGLGGGPVGEGEPYVYENASVPEGERELILSAVAKLVFANGYSQLSAQHICAAAGIRRKAFEIHFEDVDDCFLSALELRTSRAFEQAAAQASAEGTWSEGVNRVIAALCDQLARDPALAKLVFIEAPAAGEKGLLCREGIRRAIAERFRISAPSESRPTRLKAEASVAAVSSLLYHQVISGRAQQLPRLVPTLSLLALAPTIGPAATSKETLTAS